MMSESEPVCFPEVRITSRKIIVKIIPCLALLLAIGVCFVQAQDATGCKDSPLISRFPGSVLTSCADKADDVFSFTMGSGKPESAGALQEVVKLFKQDPKLKVYVVGHTDNVGALAANLDLSKRRAAAVVQELITKYAIAADRLQAFGDSPYAPLASNDAEDGRALNRRVELVKQ
jgi:flagellar motor protein MotB